jgi:hypothetical protein
MPKFVPSGQGKGWAKGRTAATDPRVARNAARRRGMTYRRHRPPEQDRRYRHGSARTLPLEWSDMMAYVVGLMATDGNLSKDGRHLAFDSGDLQLIHTFLSCLGHPYAHTRSKQGELGGIGYQAAFSDVRFHRWLRGIGLMPRKSLVLGGIDVPDAHLPSLLRGLFEGDGHVQNFVHRPTPSTYPDYEYERLWVFFNSASRPHLQWIKSRVETLLGLRGYIERLKTKPGRHHFFRLKYGKHGSIALLRTMYPSATVPKLERKWKIWDDYARRNLLN